MCHHVCCKRLHDARLFTIKVSILNTIAHLGRPVIPLQRVPPPVLRDLHLQRIANGLPVRREHERRLVPAERVHVRDAPLDALAQLDHVRVGQQARQHPLQHGFQTGGCLVVVARHGVVFRLVLDHDGLDGGLVLVDAVWLLKVVGIITHNRAPQPGDVVRKHAAARAQQIVFLAHNPQRPLLDVERVHQLLVRLHLVGCKEGRQDVQKEDT